MIDSVFPCRKVTDNYPRTLESVEAACPLPQELPSDRRTQSLHCLLSGHNMLREWSPPTFSHLARPLPPMVLLQATGKVYGESESTHYFDLVRDSGYLGWEEYMSAPFIARLEIPGHHFGVFDEAHVCPAPCLVRVVPDIIPGLTSFAFKCHDTAEQLKNACSLLENKNKAA